MTIRVRHVMTRLIVKWFSRSPSISMISIVFSSVLPLLCHTSASFSLAPGILTGSPLRVSWIGLLLSVTSATVSTPPSSAPTPSTSSLTIVGLASFTPSSAPSTTVLVHKFQVLSQLCLALKCGALSVG